MLKPEHKQSYLFPSFTHDILKALERSFSLISLSNYIINTTTPFWFS